MGSADEPLFALIAGPSADPSEYYTTSAASSCDDDAQVSAKKIQFWLESHAFSCVQHSSFQSSAELTLRDVMPLSFIDSADDVHDKYELIMNIIGGDSCAYIATDGVIHNPDNNTAYKTAICRHGEGTKNGSATNYSLSLMTNEQIETIGRCAAHIVTNNNSQRRRDAASTSANNQAYSASGNSSWFQSPIKVAKKVSSVINYAIDSALNIYDGGDYYATANDDLEGADVDDATESMDALRKISFDDNLDDEQSRRKGDNAATCRINQEIDISDDVISISSVAMACNHLLQYSQRMNLDDSDDVNDIFVLGDNIGEVERIMLERNGWSKGSLGALCRQAGKFFKSSSKEDGSEKDAFIRLCIGKLLSTISTEGLKESPSKSDHAMYQIHVTKRATHNRIQRLEKDAETAKNNAISYQKKKMTKVALVHMRRRKAALEEIDRCAAILENLTAGELRLERAKGDVQVVQSYTQLKEALQDVRRSSGMENDDVEELMSDIREEMELANSDALTEAVYNSDVIDEDELYEEFRLLELECDKKSHSPRNLDVKVDFPSGKEVVDEPTQSPVTDEKPQKSTSKPNGDVASPMPS
eukprot:scaffold6338_cov102-Skeletonema_marinoi.AAC.4